LKNKKNNVLNQNKTFKNYWVYGRRRKEIDGKNGTFCGNSSSATLF
jgi:hypothetical protein